MLYRHRLSRSDRVRTLMNKGLRPFYHALNPPFQLKNDRVRTLMNKGLRRDNWRVIDRQTDNFVVSHHELALHPLSLGLAAASETEIAFIIFGFHSREDLGRPHGINDFIAVRTTAAASVGIAGKKYCRYR